MKNTLMTRFRTILLWLVVHTLLGAVLYFGLVKGVDGAANLVQFYIWFCFVVSLLTLPDAVLQTMRKHNKPSVPRWIDAVFAVGAISTLVWHGWVWAASAYAVSAILLARARQTGLDEPPTL